MAEKIAIFKRLIKISSCRILHPAKSFKNEEEFFVIIFRLRAHHPPTLIERTTKWEKGMGWNNASRVTDHIHCQMLLPND